MVNTKYVFICKTKTKWGMREAVQYKIVVCTDNTDIITIKNKEKYTKME